MALRLGVTWLAWLLVGLAGCGDNAQQAPAVGLQSIAIAPSRPAIAAGTSVQLTATGTDADGATMDVSGLVNWTSTSTSIARVSPTGLLTGIVRGDVTIAVSRSGVTGTTTATVGDAVLVALQVVASASNLEIHERQALAATGTYSDGFAASLTSEVTWSSDNPGHVTVSDTGIVTGVAAGFATITATQGTVSGALPMSVDEPVPISIEIMTDPPGLLRVQIGASLQLTAVVTFSDLSTQRLAADAVQWISDDPDIATVDAAGLVTPVRVGTATVLVATDTLLSVGLVAVLPAD